ncbi:MAG: sigma 54-interacting transcriptional regulator [Polyangiaceae bacterium]
MDETVQRPMGVVEDERTPPAQLRVVFPLHLVATLPLGRSELVLGRGVPGSRGPERGVALDDPTVSRRHFAVRGGPGGVHHGLDLGSRNGSRIEGRRQSFEAAPRLLEDGDVVRIGDVILVYERGTAVEVQDAPEVSREAIFGEAATTRRLRRAVAKASPDPSPVLLVGETGTGKEYIAREVHRLSGRSGPVVAVNCAALSPQLIESQLFGHKKGAFTGAQTSHDGLFRAAQGGTIFLDEIGELPRELQPKLLRVIQEGEVHPVGETRPVKVDVRIVSATLQDLSAMVEAGSFRLDLHARLRPWEIAVPALRDRRADVLPWLLRLHAAWHAERNRSRPEPPALDANGVERLLLHDWPDNLRGLDRLVHQICSEPGAGFDVHSLLRASSSVRLPRGRADEPRAPAAPPAPESEPVGSMRRPRPSKEELALVLEAHEGSIRATAKHYGRDRRQIYRWLEQYGLRDPE